MTNTRRLQTAILIMLLIMGLLLISPSKAAIPKVEGAGAFTSALDTMGTLWCWGINENGGRGAPEYNDQVCVPVTMTTGVKTFAVGEFHTIVVYEDGTAASVGLNSNGELGTGDNQKKTSLTNVMSLTDIKEVSAGVAHTLFLLDNGDLYAAGRGHAGEVGDSFDHYVPHLVLQNVTHMDARGHHSLAQTTDGKVWAWGWNGYNQLGVDGGVVTSSVPIEVPVISNTTTLACGDVSSYAVMNGKVWAWGYNGDGRLGVGDFFNRPTPTKIMLDNVIDIDAGGSGVVILTQDDVYVAGNYITVDGGLDLHTPISVGLGPSVEIGSGKFQHFAIDDDGVVWGWGLNTGCQLGEGDTDPQVAELPVKIFQADVGLPDEDGDGVPDETDTCPNTPHGEIANGDGCSSSQVDTDEDGVMDNTDLCPDTPQGSVVDGNGCADSQKDSDNDGIMDDLDQCPNTPNGAIVDANGCATGQLDTDGDGIADDVDLCPNTPQGSQVDINGCADSQKDTDGDGITDDIDSCPGTPPGSVTDNDGCSQSQIDTDGDGVMNDEDNCVLIDNPNQTDTDDDGVGDACDDECGYDDMDGDGTADCADNCPDVENPNQLDIDDDGVGDDCDNCPDVVNTDQTDTDEDGIGDACENDQDNERRSAPGGSSGGTCFIGSL